MRDKIVFFLLGGLVATIAYVAGCTTTNLSAQKSSVPFLLNPEDTIVKKHAIFETVIVRNVLAVNNELIIEPKSTVENIRKQDGFTGIVMKLRDGTPYIMLGRDLQGNSGGRVSISIPSVADFGPIPSITMEDNAGNKRQISPEIRQIPPPQIPE